MLVNPETECITKHLLTSEAFLAEAGSAGSGSEREREKLLKAVGQLAHAEMHSLEVSPPKPELSKQIRTVRKQITFSQLSPTQAQQTVWELAKKPVEGECPTCKIASAPFLKASPQKKLNTKPDITHVTGDKKKMARKITQAVSNIVVGFVGGTVGTALHFLGFKGRVNFNVGPIKGLALIDWIVGAVLTYVGTTMGQLPEWARSMMFILGGVFFGLGFANQMNWDIAAVPAPPPPAVRTPFVPRTPVTRVPSAPQIF